MSKKDTQPAQQLDFFEVHKIATRDEMRPFLSQRTERLNMVDISHIQLRPDDFNWRRRKNLSNDEWNEVLGIPELAQGIYNSNGPDDALIGDFTKDGIFYINEGERRYRALQYLMADKSLKGVYPNGNPISNVEIILNPKGFTELDRKRRIFTSQNKMALKPMELAYGYLSLKTENNLTHEQIADELGISRQKVDNYIKATELPEETQAAIDEGTVKITNAISALRQSKKKDIKPVDMETGEVLENGVLIAEGAVKELLEHSSLDANHDFSNDLEYDTTLKDYRKAQKANAGMETEDSFAAELESRKTDPKFREPRPKTDREDALGKVDWNKEKTEAEMDLEQAIKWLDKLAVSIDKQLPDTQKQYRQDYLSSIQSIQRKIMDGLDRIKKAPSKVE